MVTITGPWKIISLCSIPVNQAMLPLTSKAVILKKEKAAKIHHSNMGMILDACDPGKHQPSVLQPGGLRQIIIAG